MGRVERRLVAGYYALALVVLGGTLYLFLKVAHGTTQVVVGLFLGWDIGMFLFTTLMICMTARY